MRVNEISVEKCIDELGLDEWIDVGEPITFTYPNDVDTTLRLYEQIPVAKEIIEYDLDEQRIDGYLEMVGYFHQQRGRSTTVPKEMVGAFDDE